MVLAEMHLSVFPEYQPQKGRPLTQAGILLANSDGEQSHPIRRAVWLLDRFLGDPPAPPPPDVPELEDTNPKHKNLSIREQMEVHREKAACANCHRDIDPWGIAFEQYDAVGLWRDNLRTHPKAKPQPVDARPNFLMVKCLMEWLVSRSTC